MGVFFYCSSVIYVRRRKTEPRHLSYVVSDRLENPYLHAEVLVINGRQVLLVSFLRYRADTPSLPVPFSATGPFAKIRLPQPREDGKFFVVAVFLSRCFARALPVPFSSH